MTKPKIRVRPDNSEDVLNVWLEESENYIELVVQRAASSSVILTIKRKNLEILRDQNVDPSLGLPLDTDRRIELTGEDD